VKSWHHPVCTRAMRVLQQQTEIKSEVVDWFAGVACRRAELRGEESKRWSERRRPRSRPASQRRMPVELAEIQEHWPESTGAVAPHSSRRSARAQRWAPSPDCFDCWELSGGREALMARRRPIRFQSLWALRGTERGTRWAPQRPRCQAEVSECVSSSTLRAKCPNQKDYRHDAATARDPLRARSAVNPPGHFGPAAILPWVVSDELQPIGDAMFGQCRYRLRAYCDPRCRTNQNIPKPVHPSDVRKRAR